jgi:hypothetical protein
MDGQQPTQALACATQGERIGLPPPGHPAASPPGYRDSTSIHADPAIQIIIEAAYLGCSATGCSFHVRGMYKTPRSYRTTAHHQLHSQYITLHRARWHRHVFLMALIALLTRPRPSSYLVILIEGKSK